MNKINRNYLQITLAGSVLTLLLTGCPSGQPSQTITQESPAPTPTPAATPAPSPTPAAPTNTATATVPIAGLIPSTDPAARKQAIAKQRTDPFTGISIQPTITVIPEIVTAVPVPTTITTPSGGANSSRGRGGSTAGGAKKTALRPPIVRPVQPPPPPPPNPAEAKGVLVSGIIQLGNIPLAVVQAPGERTERRVTTGARLSNGQVLVKAIDTNPDNPSVTLEQYGISVVRRLGEGIEKPNPSQPPNPQAKIIF